MSLDETLRAIDGALSEQPDPWLAHNVLLEEPLRHVLTNVRRDVLSRLLEIHRLTKASDVKITLDEGRGVAECLDVACAFEVEDGLVRTVRLYGDPRNPPCDE